MGRRPLDNPRVQEGRAKTRKGEPQGRRFRAIERRLDYLEAEVSGRREMPPGIVVQGQLAQDELNRSVSNFFHTTGHPPQFLFRRRPFIDLAAWLAEDMEIPRAYVLLAPAFGALCAALALWSLR